MQLCLLALDGCQGQHSLDLSNKSANCIRNALGTNGFGNTFDCSIETNFLSPTVMVTLLKALLATKSIEEFRAANQVCKFGDINKIIIIFPANFNVIFPNLLKYPMLFCCEIDFGVCGLQRSQVLGNKIEMQITELVEQNFTLLRLGLHLEYNDARHRVAAHLQRNLDRSKCPRPPPPTP
jgi:tropomodulin